MRVLYLVSWVDIPTRLLIEEASRRGAIAATVLSDDPGSCAQFSTRVAWSPVRSRGKLDLAAVIDLRERIAAGRFDLIHAQSSRFLANALLATQHLRRAPAVCGFVGHLSRRYSRWNPVHRLTYLHPRLAGVSCNCQAAAQPLVRCGVPAERVFTIYAGHPSRERATPPDLSVRAELGLPADATVVGFVGNMRPVKGADLLLAAARRLRDEPALRWLLVGRIEDARVRRMVDHPELRDRVLALGWRDDAERLMTAMDIFAMPSRSEGFSRAITEAMELGLCPVASRVGGTAELVRDGVDGLVVPPGDVGALAAAIGGLVRDPARRRWLAASARERIRTAFTVDRMVDATLAMYRQVLAQSSPATRRRAA